MASDDEAAARALAEVDRRIAARSLAKAIDADHKVAQFVGPNYARHRFP
jgi:hypothetical protein